jgi:hypothetical protein
MFFPSVQPLHSRHHQVSPARDPTSPDDCLQLPMRRFELENSGRNGSDQTPAGSSPGIQEPRYLHPRGTSNLFC